jgi:hypothetical protein
MTVKLSRSGGMALHRLEDELDIFTDPPAWMDRTIPVERVCKGCGGSADLVDTFMSGGERKELYRCDFCGRTFVAKK